MANDTAKPGLCYVTAKVRDPSKLSDEKFNDFYDNEHLPDMLRYNFSKVALRYKNANANGTAPYAALYPLEDITSLSSPSTAQMMEECRKSKTLDGQDHHELIEYGIGAWRTIQTFEGYGHAEKTGHDRGKTLVAVSIEPGDGQAAEADLDAWYRRQHLDMLAMCKGYRRTTRYKRVGDASPRFLALHEYVCDAADFPTEQIEQVRQTEWSRDVLGKAKAFERDVWELIGVQGEKALKL